MCLMQPAPSNQTQNWYQWPDQTPPPADTSDQPVATNNAGESGSGSSGSGSGSSGSSSGGSSGSSSSGSGGDYDTGTGGLN